MLHPLTRLRLVALFALLLAPAAARGQERDSVIARDQLPRDVAREVVELFNATTTLRATERTEIAAGREVVGNVSVLNGPVTIGGRVTGRVLAINADVILLRGARIDGDLLVVGGEVEGSDGATIGGELRIYHPSLRYSQEGDQLVVQADGAGADDQWWRWLERRGRSNFDRLEVATAGVYNRVEGLPIRIGPVLYRDQGWGHVRMDATAIVRTGSSFSSTTPDVGHDVRADARVGRTFGATFGGRLFELVEGVEEWQLSDAEVGLASFVFHRDYRDYYRRHGGEVYAALRATENADLTLSYGHERWSSRPTRDPFALIKNGLSWRENPVMDAGRFHLATVTLRMDTRNDASHPWAGWYLLASFENGTGFIDLEAPPSAGVPGGRAGRTEYQRGFFDIRRYNRLAPNAQLNLRVLLAGWIGGNPLPMQRRLSIDGPGTVPGFDFRSEGGTDVGTCAVGQAAPGRPAQCERIGLAQLEFRRDIRLSLLGGEGRSSGTKFRADGAWVFFADAGRGWLVNAPGSALDVRPHQLPSLSTYRTDIGGGLDFDHFGIYVAKAVSEPSEAANVFFRIRHRF